MDSVSVQFKQRAEQAEDRLRQAVKALRRIAVLVPGSYSVPPTPAAGYEMIYREAIAALAAAQPEGPSAAEAEACRTTPGPCNVRSAQDRAR